MTEEEDILLADLLADLDVGSVRSAEQQSAVQNEPGWSCSISVWLCAATATNTHFMLDVPDASVPAVEMCSLMSFAGMMTSARLTE